MDLVRFWCKRMDSRDITTLIQGLTIYILLTTVTWLLVTVAAES